MKDIKLIIVGSIGLDTIETPRHRKETILGGSLSGFLSVKLTPAVAQK